MNPDLEHALRNHLAIILGFTELLMQETPPGNRHRSEYQEIHKAATAALRVLTAPTEDRP
ncbi:MAG: hypothetical protein ABIQ52_19640 [Vicinamibacterales bacterium]